MLIIRLTVLPVLGVGIRRSPKKMTEICEAYSRGGMDAATPHGGPRGPACPVQGWSWQLRTLGITRF